MNENKEPQRISPVAVIEAALFLNHGPLSLDKLKNICGLSSQELSRFLEQLKANLESSERGLVLLESPEGVQLGTKPETAAFVEKLFEQESFTAPLSQAALETLAIIALKQPVTRVEIEHIRGVKGEGVIDNLLKRGLITITGRKEGLGRPFLYSVTEEFVRYFGLKSLDELEVLQEMDS